MLKMFLIHWLVVGVFNYFHYKHFIKFNIQENASEGDVELNITNKKNPFKMNSFFLFFVYT